MDAEGRIYGRYGGRDASGADSRNSLAGLRYAMQGVLELHRSQAELPLPPRKPPLLIEKVAAARGVGGCIHCHQAKEILRQEEVNTTGKWRAEERWVFPLPENLGITLELDRGNVVQQVRPGSPAAAAGIEAGDVLHQIDARPVHSFADVQYALHKAPAAGAISIGWRRDQRIHEAELNLAQGWKKTNITWRPSLMDLLPSLPIFGTDLTAKEKRQLGLDEKRLAFRQDPPIPLSAEKMGVREQDIILGINDLPLEMNANEFLGYVRQNFLIGDRITLNLIRGNKRIDVPVTLR